MAFQWLLPLTLVFRAAHALPFFTNGTIPTNLTTTCANALLTDVIQCPPTAARFMNGFYYPPATLEKACTSACSTALEQYETQVRTACVGQTWAGYDDENDAPLDMIPNLMRYNWDLACIQDSGRWCNVVAAAAAVQADPGQSPVGWDSTPPTDVQFSGPCDLCFIKNLQKQAGSPYYYGPQLQSSSIYQSKTSSCGVAGYPLTTSTLPWSLPQAATPTPSSCAGKKYTVASGDDCYKVSKTNGIGTAWLLSDNNLAAYCSEFPTSGELCIQNTCEIYTVNTTDTCESMAKSNNITIAQLKAWNPIINAGCHNLYKMNETSICVSNPGEAYVTPPASPPLAPSTATSAAPVPTNAKDESNRNCGSWYNVEEGDYCNLVTMRYGLSLEDFVFLNPSLNSNCTNLLLDISYCVAPVGDINDYSGRPGYHTPGATGLPFTKVTFAPASTTWTPQITRVPFASGTRDDCYRYFDGSRMQTDISGTNFRHQCDLAASVYDVSLEEILLWNPDLGTDVNTTSCSFKEGVRYCGRFYVDQPPTPVEGPEFSFPLREGYDVNCTDFADVPKDFTCSDVLDVFELTIAQFYRMNPAVGPDCSNLWTEQAYCMASPNTPAPSPSTSILSVAPSSTSMLGPSAPTHTGQPANCVKWHTVVDGDNCASVADEYFITLEQFFAWNPAVSSDCTTNFWKDQAYCVGTSDSISISRSAQPTPTPTSGLVVPTPNQPNNVVSDCNKVAQALEGDYCYLFAERNGITTTQLYAWNRVLENGDACGSSFWKDYWTFFGVLNTAMEKLPQELINKIVLYLERYPNQPQVPIIEQQSREPSKLPPYAMISSHWREAVEFVTFHRLLIKSDELSQLRAIVTGNRRKYLTKLRFIILIPEYSEEQCGRVESKEEQQSNNECFTQIIVDLFSTLRQWEDAGLLCGLRLQLEHVHSPIDLRDRNQIRLEIAQGKRDRDIFEKRWEDSYLDLSESNKIPTLSNLTYLNVQGSLVRKLAPAVGPRLAAFLPNVTSLFWNFGEGGDHLINVENRTTFAKMLEQTKLQQRSVAEIDFHSETPSDQRLAVPSRIPPGALYDPFSASLRVFSQNLTSLALRGYFDSTLFWPSSHETCSTPTWPFLKTLKVFFNMATPSGDWYFDGSTASSDEQFREHGNPKTLDPFLTAFAKAVQRMPVLTHFVLETELGYDTGFWDISYHAPGQRAETGDESEDDVGVRRVYYTVGELWRPDYFIAEAFRGIGREIHGSELIERFLEPRSWTLDCSMFSFLC
ncbi:carbohydrate-binding module family 50 protein [Dothidotthia symphoricarpi CBS 119687]|uniref:Carbohydrate-binding module family 50 protein n=1 Tax=Dothidotthia symphoricarpi CBS 119687 TaxID=1392245 RepID=A0A6A6A4J3_9PLEO|nr:carbohydrate-binding module family 50 protein [Dothidotthia symphoricarpi CBS 119687]KAF2126083.1 carbohydrate-binding module family 50 protein [Dothidotthia symphoricarpi CBS 119687]